MDGAAPDDRLAEATKDEESEGKFWADQIDSANKTERDWRKDAARVQERYRNEKRRNKTTFPVFWSNIQVLKPNVYSQTPRPDVRRRAVHEDPIRKELGRQAATVIESGLRYEIDNAAWNHAMEAARDDMLIVGRGVVREAYAFETVKRPFDPLVNMAPDGFDGEGEDAVPYVNAIENERTETRYVFWADYRQSPARNWSDVWWVAFRHAMDTDELKREFPDHDPKKIPRPLSAKTDGKDAGRANEMPADPESPFGRAEVWEIWSKRTKERLWIATGYEDHVLRKDEDPLRVVGFFPMPCPIYAVPTTDSMVPMPELQVYETLADELDEVQDRLRKLTAVAKVVTLSDGDFIETMSISTAKDGDIIPIHRPEVMAKDLNGGLWRWPIDMVVQAIALLTQRSEALKQAIYELTGISDLRRGIGQERESATAQKLKASYGTARMTPRSKPMAEFVRDLLRIKAEIMAEHFEPASLERISGSMVPPPVIALLKEEKFRLTTIDVETDSTVAPDAEAEKAEAIEFTTAIVTYLQAAMPVGQAAPAMIPLLVAILRAVARPFKFSRHVEQEIDAAADLITAAAQQPSALPAPPPGGNGAAQPGMLQ